MTETSSDTKNIVRGTSIVSLLTLTSRFFGFLRDHVLARFLGAGALTDIFFVAFRLPNLLRNLVAEGALSSAFLPVLAQEKNKDKEHASIFFHQMLFLVLIVTVLLSLLGIYFSPEIVSFVGVGFKNNPENYTLCIELSRIVFPYIIFVSNIALINATLITFNVYGGSALAQITMNLVLIAAASMGNFLTEIQTLYCLTFGTLIGGALQILIQFPLLNKVNLKLRYSFSLINQRIKKVLILFAPAFIGAAVGQIITFLNTMLASTLAEGSVSWLHYADRLAQLPIGIFSVALGSVIFPNLANNVAKDDSKQFNKSFINGLRYLSFVLIPASAFLFTMSEDLVKFFFESGKFNYFDTIQTSIALKALSLSIWASGCYALTVRAFHAKKNTKTPCMVAVCILVIGFNISLVLMGKIDNSNNSSLINFLVSIQSFNLDLLNSFGINIIGMGHIGLALTSLFSSSISLLILLRLLINKCKLEIKEFLISSLKALVASILMCLVINYIGELSKISILNVILKALIGGFSFIAISFILKNKELKETYSQFLR